MGKHLTIPHWPSAASIVSYRTQRLVATGDKPVLVYPLLEHHVDVNVTDPTAADATPLIIAARHGDSPLVKALLRANADVTRRDRNGKTALAYARQWGNPEIVALLTEAGAKE